MPLIVMWSIQFEERRSEKDFVHFRWQVLSEASVTAWLICRSVHWKMPIAFQKIGLAFVLSLATNDLAAFYSTGFNTTNLPEWLI
jgi:hypothetical protein